MLELRVLSYKRPISHRAVRCAKSDGDVDGLKGTIMVALGHVKRPS